MYAERPSIVAGAVAWTNSSASGDTVQVLPDGCIDLLWFHDRLVIAGPDTYSQPSEVGVGRSVVGLRFAPGTAPSLLGIPAHAVRDQRVALDSVWAPAVVRRLEERVAARRDPARGLEAIAADRRRRAGPVAPVVVAVVAGLRAGLPVGEVADAAGLSERQLHRRSLDAFGYGPKTLGRILRLQRALDLARDGRSFVESALDAGYADQAHLARDARALTGETFTRLTA